MPFQGATLQVLILLVRETSCTFFRLWSTIFMLQRFLTIGIIQKGASGLGWLPNGRGGGLG